MITSTSAFIASHLLGCGSRRDDDYRVVDEFIREALKAGNTPGLAACVVGRDGIEWSAGYGWADIAGAIRMTPNKIQNIGSISKTITATAVMQQWEEKKFDLDDDVGDYLPFPVRNPRFPDIPITFRQLLTHTSSITDGPAYEPSYACGDPTVSLMDWLQAYFDPVGINYDFENNFLDWRPGTLAPPREPRPYSNLGFGLLGGLVESIASLSFADYCQQRIFDSLGMNNTGWYLNDIDEVQHAVPYGSTRFPPILVSSDNDDGSFDSEYYGHCLYSFPNYPDGLLRTSVEDLARFLRAYIGLGEFDSARILNEATVRSMLTESHNGQGLCWSNPDHLSGDLTIWGHSGGDPGINTTMDFSRRRRKGVIVFSNFDGWGDLVLEISKRLFEIQSPSD